jgi:hypothetical protein
MGSPFPGDQLALDLERHHEEEQRHRAVVHPVSQGQARKPVPAADVDMDAGLPERLEVRPQALLASARAASAATSITTAPAMDDCMQRWTGCTTVRGMNLSEAVQRCASGGSTTPALATVSDMAYR